MDRFYLIVPDAGWIERLVPLGVGLVQLRLKNAAEDDTRAQIRRAQQVCTTHGAQLVVNDHLRTSAHQVYALGDCAATPWIDGKTVPARAQAAHQQGTYLAKMLYAALKEGHFDEPFVYKDFGSLVSLGDNKGVGNLMGGLSGKNFFVQGLVAKWMYMSLHLMHHRAILGTVKTGVLALARLLQQRVSGRMKLH